MDLTRCSTVLFDAGDTLIELHPSLKTVLVEFCTDELKTTDPEQRADEFIVASEMWEGIQRSKEAKGAPKMASPDLFKNKYLTGLKTVLPDTRGEELHPLYEELRNRFKGMEWVAPPDATPVLESLKKNGYTLGVVSNFSPNLPDILEKEGLLDYFACIVVSSIVRMWKPDPKIMTAAAEELSVPAEECVYIGDNPFDVQCSKDAGMRAVWLNRYYTGLPGEISHEPDGIIRELGELKRMVSSG